MKQNGSMTRWLTIWVHLFLVGYQPTVIYVIRNSIIIIIKVTSISFSILVMICLVGIRNVRAIVYVVLMAILINILVVVTLISYKVIICINLLGIKNTSAVVKFDLCWNVYMIIVRISVSKNYSYSYSIKIF